MKIHTLILAFGALVGAAVAAQAQPAAAPSDPLAELQGDFGTVVGNAFHAPDQVVVAASPGAPTALGGALRTGLEVPGAAFAALMKPFADADPVTSPAPAPAPRLHRHARLRHHHAPAQG